MLPGHGQAEPPKPELVWCVGTALLLPSSRASPRAGSPWHIPVPAVRSALMLWQKVKLPLAEPLPWSNVWEEAGGDTLTLAKIKPNSDSLETLTVFDIYQWFLTVLQIHESSPLDLASEEPERLPCLRRLLQLGADVNAADKNGLCAPPGSPS